jgi:AmmeMemoRadiSam system protein B
MVREPAVQGTFYPAGKTELEKQLQNFFSDLKASHNAPAIIAPHAGYVYSGRIAAKAFAALKKAKTFVILSPNHTGLGSAVSIYPQGQWQNSLGQVKVNDKLATELAEKVEGAELDESAHLQEHSIEVMLPFLQFLFQGFKIVPITLAEHNLERLKALAQALADLSEQEDLALIASSDFTHFEAEESAKKKDLAAIDLVKQFKPEAFFKLVSEKNLSICGFAPIIVLLYYCQFKGLKKSELLEYGSSAQTTQDKSNVVGYAALKFA